MNKLILFLGLSSALFLGSQARAAAVCASPGNLVMNCGFETGDLSGWTVLGDATGAGVDSFDAHSGSYGAYLAGYGSVAAGNTNYTDLRQMLSTTVGQAYSLRYYTAYFPSATATPDNVFFAEIGGGRIDTSLQSNVTSAPWTLDGSFLFTATASTTQLDFLAEDANFYFSLDDIAVTAVTATPEPASFALILLGLGGLFAFVAARKPA